MTNVVLIVDMLRGFLEDGHNLYCGDSAREIIPNVKRLIKDQLDMGAEIIYICDSHKPDDLEFEMFPVHCVAGTSEAEIIPELIEYPGYFIPKQRYSGFFNTDLEKKLEQIKPENIIICGVCTDICVLHTAADARNRDYNVSIPVDCVASFDYDAHNWAINHMRSILGVRLI
ncbi:MAG: cysteine hydrolase [Dehalococcoidia bacterium]|nr:hypothetical protein [Chloroflexota bacterium]MCH2525926.1 cysteine hydrolase [Dehalococcoidia bacterium]|tara:strand:+ start:3476 stop:3991 length:516 start_codon:yes stop_codon:yes gene_type:complete